MTETTLFQPFTLGSLQLSNRVVMAPLTRNRAGAGLVPSEHAATYYSQRASAGLIITEATQVSAQAQGYQAIVERHPNLLSELTEEAHCSFWHGSDYRSC